MYNQLAETTKPTFDSFFSTSYQHPYIDSLKLMNQTLRGTTASFDLEGHI